MLPTFNQTNRLVCSNVEEHLVLEIKNYLRENRGFEQNYIFNSETDC